MEQNSEETVGGASSENGSERAGIKRLKLQENEDRISTLPDSLIQHILSFLPSTKEAIQTGILSKRWENQWTRVPVLIFDSTGKSGKNFSQFIDTPLTLHDCSKLNKFHIQYDDKLGCYPYLTSKIRFPTRKDVEELILHLYPLDDEYSEHQFMLPKFLFNNDSLVKLELFNCYVMRDQIINWSRLKELKLECSTLNDSALENVVSGSPVLELLELRGHIMFPDIVIASKSVKRLFFFDIECEGGWDRIEILCPNLEELSFNISEDAIFSFIHLPNQTIENVLSGCPLLHTLELQYCFCPERHVIALNSLKKLVLGVIYGTSDYEISCSNLEEVNLYRFVPREFCFSRDIESQSKCLAMKILRQLQHVNRLEFGSFITKILSPWEIGAWVVGSIFSPLVNCKCLTLDGSNFDANFLGIVSAIRNSPTLEKLVIKLHLDQLGDLPNLDVSRRKNYWNSIGTDFNCSLSNLKTIKVIGLSERDDKHKFLLDFVEHMLKNARMLDKIVVILADCVASVPFEVSKKLLSLQRCFPHTTIELLCSI